MRNHIMKGLIGLSTVIVSLFVSKAALAKDCKEPMVFVSGVQQFAGPDNTSHVVRDGETIRVTFYCNDGKARGLTTSSGLSKSTVKSAQVQKKGNIEIKLSSENVDFIGVVHGNVGDNASLSFTDDGGSTYTVTIPIGDKIATQGAIDNLDAKKADKGDLEKKANVGDSYTKPETDKKFMPLGTGFGNDGRSRLQLMPLAIFRTDGADPAGGVSGLFGYHVPNPSDSGFEFAVAASYARGRLDNRAVSGIPLTEPNVFQDITRVKALGCYDIVAGSRVNIPLCGGLFLQWLHVPDTSLGQDPASGTVWANHAQNDIMGGALLSLAFNVVLTGDQHRGLYLGLGADPLFPFAQTYKVNGGEKRYVVSFDTYAALGLRL